jgi:hypothetical protein
MLNEGLISLELIFALVPITWLLTKFYKPSLIATKFANNRKEALTAIEPVGTLLREIFVICFVY